MKTKTKNTAIGALLVAITCAIWVGVNRTDESTELDTVYTLSEVTPVADISSATMVNVRGKDFRHAKTKAKRGTFRGLGAITGASNSFKYSSSEGESDEE